MFFQECNPLIKWGTTVNIQIHKHTSVYNITCTILSTLSLKIHVFSSSCHATSSNFPSPSFFPWWFIPYWWPTSSSSGRVSSKGRLRSSVIYLVKSALTILSINFSCSDSSELRCLWEGGGGWRNDSNIQFSGTPFHIHHFTLLRVSYFHFLTNIKLNEVIKFILCLQYM